MGYLNETVINYSQLSTLDLFERSVENNENNVALVFNNELLTYKELNASANKIAHLLISKGIKAEDLVPLCLGSGIELITGIIAIQKAGAAYVPIDPDYPKDRIDYILNDCAATIILTDRLTRSKFKQSSLTVIELDDSAIYDDEFDAENPQIKPAPNSLAYVMYTSGTTGVPNGVMIEHHSVVNNLIWAQNYFKLTVNDVVLQKTTFCFDVSVWEIFGTLISGAKLVIINKEDYRDIKILKETIAFHKITTVHFIPTMLEFFALSLKKGECITLKRIICSGEALSPYQVNLLKKQLPNVVLYNLYGPTETTIHSSYWLVPQDAVEIEKVLIGKPIDHTQLLILNEQHQLLGQDTIGEIYIGGNGVARGYLNKPDLNAARFIKNPLSNGNDRIFKTGDFGRYLSNGEIEYLGRQDDQVKINGYRIELASIESNIKNSGIIKHAVVLTKKNNLGFLNVVAYVVLAPGYNIQNLWDHLATKLPGYMLPTSIKDVEYIPFTHNGKVDKEQLNNLLNEEIGIEPVKPRTHSERTIYAIWNNIFNKDGISIYDNFFELGGNSIMAVKMLSLLKRGTNRHISYIQLNQYPNIESLAKLLDRPNLIDIPNILIAIKPEGSKPPLYLVNGGGLVYDGFFNLSDVLDKEQPVYSFQSNGYNNNGKLFESIEEIAGYYVNSILRENVNGPFCLAGYSIGAVIAFEMATQLKALGKEVKFLATIDGLSKDPEFIKIQYTALTILRILVFNFYILKYGPVKAAKYSMGVFKGVIRKIKAKSKKKATLSAEVSDFVKEKNTDIDFDVFSLHITAYLKYKIKPYDGNMVVFRAKRKTFYMDDFIYLGWKPFVKKIKSIGIKGHHYSIYDDANVEAFAKKLQTALDEGF